MFCREKQGLRPEGSLKQTPGDVLGFNLCEKRRFLESIYQNNYKKIYDGNFYQGILHKGDWPTILKQRSKKQNYFLANFYGFDSGETFSRAILPFTESFLGLKDLPVTERIPNGNGILYNLTILCTII